MTATGWLLDIYLAQDRMVCWIKNKNNVRLEDSGTPSIHAATDDRADLKAILNNTTIMQSVKNHDFVSRREKITDLDETIVLKLTLKSPAKATALARSIERLGKFGRFRLYNVDVPPSQSYLYRHVFLQASRIAERLGFRVLHGIVDSLWVQKRNATESDYAELKKTIEQKTEFEISFEGVYKWIAFVHSKEMSKLPVTNRYFGAFEDGSLKIRGIEARRHDTPPLFEKFQHEVLEIMAGGDTVAEVKALMPQVRNTFAKYARLLKDRKVPMRDLVFVKNVSKDTNQHSGRNTVENDALGRLEKEGKMLKAGQTLRYVISDYRNARKATPLELVDERTAFDPDRYTELLAQTCNSVTEPFEYAVQANDY